MPPSVRPAIVTATAQRGPPLRRRVPAAHRGARAMTTLAAIVSAVIAVAGHCAAAVDPSETAALLDLYNNTSGPAWVDNSGWQDGASGRPSDPCDALWFGVSCSDGPVSHVT